MAKRNKRKRVAIDDASSMGREITVDDDFGDMLVPEVVPTKQPLRWLKGPELRDAHVEILALRVLKEPIPEHLAINDRLDVCGLAACRRVVGLMTEAGTRDPARVREFADLVIPPCRSI